MCKTRIDDFSTRNPWNLAETALRTALTRSGRFLSFRDGIPAVRLSRGLCRLRADLKTDVLPHR